MGLLGNNIYRRTGSSYKAYENAMRTPWITVEQVGRNV